MTIDCRPNRRGWMRQTAGVLGGASLAGLTASSPAAQAGSTGSVLPDDFSKLTYCFNTATLRGKQLPITQLIDLVAEAGYDGIEVWIDDLDRHVDQGGTLQELKARCDDKGLRVESAIAFANWLAEDPEQARQAQERAKQDMEKVATVGGACIAAPPAGHNDRPITDWELAAERLDQLAAIGKQTGVQPQLEVWGFSQCLGNLSEAVRLASLAKSTDFGILLDVYHLYKGGSPFESLRLVSGTCMKLFHMNDYPAMPGRDEISDGDRVFPGDGVAPMDDILRTLVRTGFGGALSLELFNREYWEQDPRWVVQTGLKRMKDAVASAAG